MGEVKVGLIGAGYMGKLHAQIFAQMPGVRLNAIADIDIERARSLSLKTECGAECYSDYETMLANSDIDAVSIAIPDHLHKAPVIAALQAGKHVLVEKPLATCLKDCDEMIELSMKTGNVFMVNYSHRWATPYAMTKEMLDSGKIGAPVMAYARKNDTINVVTEWLPWLKKSTPVAFLSSHDIDLVRWFFKSEVRSVYARSYDRVLKSRGIDTLDAVQALVEFENGAMATFESAWIYPNTFPTATDSYTEIVAEGGVIYLDRKKEIIETANDKTYEYPKAAIFNQINGRIEGALKLSLEHFINCVFEGKEPMTSAVEARHVAEIVEAILLSAKQGKPVYLPVLH